MKQSTLGSYIRSLRVQNKMTQAALAEKLNVTDKAVSKWERDVSYPDMALFPKLANLLGVTVNDLLKESIGEGQPSRLLQIFGMSHDIRTPLHIMLGCVNLAEIHHEETEQLLRYLESIRISGEYLLRVIDQLMEITNQDPGKTGSGLEEVWNNKDRKEHGPANVQELGEYLNERAKARENALTGYDLSGKRFLVADDMSMNREIAAEILRQTGAETEFAEDGDECVKMVEEAPPGYYDLILMDILMPGTDGLEATRRIRRLQDPHKASIPIIAVSANVYEKDRLMAFEAGMNAFTEKPIFIDRLLETIRQCLSDGAPGQEELSLSSSRDS